MENIYIRGIELPLTIKGATVLDSNGDYNIYINILLSFDTQKNTREHELSHIRKDHFYDFNPVIFNELEANIL